MPRVTAVHSLGRNSWPTGAPPAVRPLATNTPTRVLGSCPSPCGTPPSTFQVRKAGYGAWCQAPRLPRCVGAPGAWERLPNVLGPSRAGAPLAWDLFWSGAPSAWSDKTEPTDATTPNHTNKISIFANAAAAVGALRPGGQIGLGASQRLGHPLMRQPSLNSGFGPGQPLAWKS